MYLFIVDDERDGYLGVVWPFQPFKTLFAITLEVSREGVVRRSSVDFRHIDGGDNNVTELKR